MELDSSKDSAAAFDGRGRRVPTATVILLALHPLAGYLYLPALPALRQALGISVGEAQWTLSLFVLSFGATQMIWGGTADRLGRRPTLWFGLLLFEVASLVGVTCPSWWSLLGVRALQGAGAAAAGVCVRAILRDLHGTESRIRALSIAFSWLGAITILLPFATSFAPEVLSPRGVFGIMAMGGLLALASLTWLGGLPLPAPPVSHRPWAAWRAILVHPVFRAYTALSAASYVGHYLFLAGSSFVLVEHRHVSVTDYALLLSAASVFHLLGTWCCRRWIALHGLRRTVARAGALTAVSGLALLTAAAGDLQSPWALIAPQWLYVFAHAMHQSCGQAVAISPFPHDAGAATGLQGTLLPTLASLAAAAMAPMAAVSWTLAAAMGLCALLTAFVARVWTQNVGDP